PDHEADKETDGQAGGEDDKAADHQQHGKGKCDHGRPHKRMTAMRDAATQSSSASSSQWFSSGIISSTPDSHHEGCAPPPARKTAGPGRSRAFRLKPCLKLHSG